MSELPSANLPEGGYILGSISIARVLTDAGDDVFVQTFSNDGSAPLALIESLGMLDLARAVLINMAFHPPVEADDE